MKSMLVTGGAGFIGSNFIRHVFARRADIRILALDKLTYAGNLLTLRDLLPHPRFKFVKGDISDGRLVRRLFGAVRPDYVLNFAAESHVDRSIEGPRPFIQSNLVGAFELLEASRLYLSREAPAARKRFRFLHVSTDEVYGSLGKKRYFKETTPYEPHSPYSASKAGADHLVGAYVHTYALPAILTNCSNNYGPYQYPEKLIPLTLLNAAEGRPLPIYGDGLNVRDWLYVRDHCEALLLALLKGRPGQKYNVGGSGERTNLQVVDAICRYLEETFPASGNPALRKRGIVRYDQLKTFVKDRPGHDRRYAIDASKIRKELGWKPRKSFDEGIRETVRWYLLNRRWCAAVQAGQYQRQRLGLVKGEK